MPINRCGWRWLLTDPCCCFWHVVGRGNGILVMGLTGLHVSGGGWGTEGNAVNGLKIPFTYDLSAGGESGYLAGRPHNSIVVPVNARIMRIGVGFEAKSFGYGPCDLWLTEVHLTRDGETVAQRAHNLPQQLGCDQQPQQPHPNGATFVADPSDPMWEEIAASQWGGDWTPENIGGVGFKWKLSGTGHAHSRWMTLGVTYEVCGPPEWPPT